MKKIVTLSLFLLCNVIFSQDFIEPEKQGTQMEINELNTLIEKYPSSENYYYRGYFNYQNNNYFDALLDYDKAIQLS
ncbi:MAG: hypothetical protein EAZ58_06310, partial [Flavobacterium sp.]